ncbi:MAG: MmcQ/YjbR family DNA-binding protein [Planctomycetes bacterium]|nr:MmcQ/YjbR family DNA-binding protein [Planctomycetota bacterium]
MATGKRASKAKTPRTRSKRTSRAKAVARDDAAPRHPLHPLSGADARRELARVRRLCLALPEATEKLAWGTPTWRAGKIFAMFADHHHGTEHVALWIPAPKGAQEILVASEPARFFRPAYVGPSGWVGVILTNIGDERLKAMVLEAYRLVAPKRAIARLPKVDDE